MIDRLSTLVLTVCVLAGGTLAVGLELLKPRPIPQTNASVAQLPRVVIIGKKQPATTEIARADASAASKLVE